MKRLNLSLLFLFLTLTLYSQYTPFKLDTRSNNDAYLNSVQRQNEQGDRIMNTIYGHIQNGVTSLEKKEYSKAKNFFGYALDLIQRNEYQRMVGEDVVKEVKDLIAYSNFKINNPDDNPFYKICIGSIWKTSGFIDVYAYGINNTLSFIIFDPGINEAIMIPAKQINEFTQLIDNLYQSGKKLNTRSKVKPKLTIKFPLYFNGYYADKKKNMNLREKLLIFDLERTFTGTYHIYAYIDSINLDNVVMIFNEKDLNDLSYFIESLHNCNSEFTKRTKTKVSDDDFFLKLMTNDIWNKIQ